MFRAGFNASREVLKARWEGKPVPEFSPPSSVRTVQTQSYKLVFELGFVTESELEALSGKSAKELGLKSISLLLEDGTTKQSGYVVSLKGVPASEVLALRRIQVERTVSVHLDNHLQRPERQLRADQGEDVFRYVASVHSGKAWAKSMTANNRIHAKSIEELRSKATELLQQARAMQHIPEQVVTLRILVRCVLPEASVVAETTFLNSCRLSGALRG